MNSTCSPFFRIVFIGVLSLVWYAQAFADCSLTSTGLTPVNDLCPGFYQGHAGGLYPQSANHAPPEHFAAGIDLATNQIRPLNASGAYDPVNGKIVMISVGMSNTTQEFSRFVTMANADPAKNPRLVIVDGAQGGQDASAWISPTAATWSTVNSRLSSAGVTTAQVQVAWVKQARANPNSLGAFPAHAQVLQSNIEAIAQNLKTNYPNTKIAYYSSRTRAYTNIAGSLNPEPFAYESAFSVRWMIENQINGAAKLNFDPARGVVVAPWLGWGPYLWADGTTPRSDGFIWLCSDLQSDFTHPSTSGVQKVDQQLLAFFKTHATAAPWFLRPPAQEITCSVSADPSEVSPGGTVAFSATASSPGHTITQYAWMFDDGDFSLAQNPSKVFPMPGLYNVRVTVSDDAGNTVTRTTPISVQTTPTSAASRKTHGLAGAFDVDLPLTGTPGIECRSGGETNDYTLVVTFCSSVIVNGNPQAQVTSGTGTIGSGGVSNGGMISTNGNSVTVPLTNVANGQTIDVTLFGVNGASNVTIPMSIVVGDTNADGAVNSSDVAQTKARLGQALDATNFRCDLNANGAITAADVGIVKSNIGNGLP